VKTIGDAYFAACYDSPNHAIKTMQVAMGMLAAIETLNKNNDTNFKIRIGCASADGVVGVLGNIKKKYVSFIQLVCLKQTNRKKHEICIKK